MKENVDVIVVGAGGNSLGTAAYLAKEGLDVLVLERNADIGGGVITKEVTAPGFKHDLHSTAHMFIQANPMIYKDELGLQEKFGLKYIESEAFFSSVFPDGSSLITYGDLEKTCASIAKFSKRDADAYRNFVAKTRKLLPLFQMGLFNPPMPFGGFMAMLDQSPDGKTMIGDMLKSSFDLVLEMFENEKVKMHFMRWSSESMMAPETRGSGSVLYLMCSFIHIYKAKFPEGGSGALSHSLQRCIEHYGGEVVTSAPVKKLIMKNGKAAGVILDDGREVHAKRAVVACVHPLLLNDFVGGDLESGIQDSISKIVHADYSAFNSHYALHEAPKYKYDDDLNDSMCVETQPESIDELRYMFDDYRYNRIPRHTSVLSICTSNLDPTRAPEGKSTLYLYTFMPYHLANGGAAKWDEVKGDVAKNMMKSLKDFTTNMTDDNIIQGYAESPLDMYRHSASFQNGDIGGAGLFMFQFMGRRPTPELANYAVPGFNGLYLVGPFMHPGGGVIGGGRPVAIKVLRDLGMPTDGFATL